MYIEWTKHLSDPEKKQRFVKHVYDAKPVLDRLYKILEEKENTLDRSEMNMQVYETPNWDYRQAHKNGNRESIAWLKQLINLDQQKENK